ncbi:MAG: preprotein translocase subunit SecB [Bacillota bacterium]|nr:preprotein translocase subunit SecB [Bacillota bacterium]
MKSSEVASELVFLGNRVITFNLSTNMINIKAQPVNVAFDFDYDIKELKHEAGNSFGLLDYIVKVRASVKRKVLFKIELVMEGAFRSETLSKEDFKSMVEVNGLITLSHISRSYIISTTAQSGINPPIRLPMVNVHKMIDSKTQKAVPDKD